MSIVCRTTTTMGLNFFSDTTYPSLWHPLNFQNGLVLCLSCMLQQGLLIGKSFYIMSLDISCVELLILWE